MDKAADYIVIVDDENKRVTNKNWGPVGSEKSVSAIRCNFYKDRAQVGVNAGGKLQFKFNGTAIEIHGKINTSQATQPSAILSCLVDGVQTELLPPPRLGIHEDQTLCGQFDLDPTQEHELEIIAVDGSGNVWVDYILYQTSFDKLSEGDVLYYRPNTPSAVTYSSGWKEVNGTLQTTQDNSTLTFNYYGLSASVMIAGQPFNINGSTTEGNIIATDNGQFLNNAEATTYSGEQYLYCPFFTLAGVDDSKANLTIGNHSLAITYQGNANQSKNIPLEITIFTVSFTTGAKASQEPSPSAKLTGGIIAAIVVGIVFGLAVVVLVAVWQVLRHRSRQYQPRPFVTLQGDNRPRRTRKGELEPPDPNHFSNARPSEPAVAIVGEMWSWARKQVRGFSTANRREQDAASRAEEAGPTSPISVQTVRELDSGIRMAGPSTSSRVVVRVEPPEYTRY